MMRVLTFSTLFPSSARPSHGIFVETRLRELLKSGQVESRVIAPVPWFPSTDPRWGDYARMAAAMREKVIFDGRNLYTPAVMKEHGFKYFSVGRRPVE